MHPEAVQRNDASTGTQILSQVFSRSRLQLLFVLPTFKKSTLQYLL